MEDEQNRGENEEQSLGKEAIEAGKQIAEQAAKNAIKQGAKKIGVKVMATIAPYIIPAIAIILIVVVLVGGIYAIIDNIREMSGEIQTAIATFLVAGDNGPIAPSPQEMVDLINKELERAGLDKNGLYLGNGIRTDIYLYKFMTASLSTQLPYIKDSPAKTLKEIATQTLLPGINAIDTFKSIVGEEVQGIVKIKRQTGDTKRDLTYKKYEDFTKLIEENNENNQTSALDYFSIDESWMLCVAKKGKTTTTNPDKTETVVNTITEVKIPYQTMISKYSIPFEFFITLQQTTQNAEYVSAVADMIQEGEIELTIFDQTEVITTEYTYKYKVRTKWIETQKISKQTYQTEILSRSFDRIVGETRIAAGKKRPTEDSGKNEEQSQTPSKGESSNSGKNEGNNDNPSKGESSNTDKNEGGSETSGKGENEDPSKNEENDGDDDDTNSKGNPVQKDETGEEQTETTITVQEINSIMASVTKADVWVIDQKATYSQDDILPEYPLGENGITTDLGDEEGAGEAAEGSWQVDRSETTKQTVEKVKWKLQNNIVDIDESEFLGLWKNALGSYIPDVKPKYDPDGILVKYQLPGKWFNFPKYESPLENLTSSEELLYDQLERSENTQTHAQLMRYLIQFYKTGEKIDISDILSLFDIYEFVEGSYIGGLDIHDEQLFITDLETLKQALSNGYSNSAKLVENAQAFLDMQEKYHVNALFAAAVSIIETSAGTRGNAVNGCNNWFNITGTNGPYRTTTNSLGETYNWRVYSSNAEGIEAFGNLIANGSYYYAQGKYTVDAIGATYCPNTPNHPTQADDWTRNVMSQMNKFYQAVGMNINEYTNQAGGITGAAGEGYRGIYTTGSRKIIRRIFTI